MNWYQNHTVYKFVLYNLYNNCMKLFVRIHTKISEKNVSRLGFQPGINIALAIVAVSAIHHLLSTTPPPPSVAILCIYGTIKKPSEKTRCTIPDN